MNDFEKWADSLLLSIAPQRNKKIDFQYVYGHFLGPSVIYRVDLAYEIIGVLRFIFDNVVWTDDLKTRGQVEHWGLPVFEEVDGRSAWRGDCDDFMAAFRLIFRKLGWDERVLRRAVCFVPTPEKPKPDFDGQINHAVLCVNSSSGLLFLDNRFQTPMSLFRLRQQGYINFSVLSASDGLWHGPEFIN